MDDLERISEVISVRLARGEMPGANFPAEWWPIVGKALRDHISLRANHDKLLAAMADGTGRQFYIDGAQAALDVANSVRIHASWGPKATPDDGLTLGIDGVKDKVRRFVAGLTNADKQMSPHRERFATLFPEAPAIIPLGAKGEIAAETWRQTKARQKVSSDPDGGA